MKNNNHKIFIGIDCGVNTGLCIWDKSKKEIVVLCTMKIHEAIKTVECWHVIHDTDVFVRVEDARLRTWFGKAGKEQLQGAGSIKRDSGIWDDFLKDLGVDYEMVPPKKNKTKLNSERFKQITGYTDKTNEHARDAAMLVYGL